MIRSEVRTSLEENCMYSDGLVDETECFCFKRMLFLFMEVQNFFSEILESFVEKLYRKYLSEILYRLLFE